MITPPTGWNQFPDPKPNVTVSGFAVDEHGRFPVLYRGPNVRSAKNCWSLPSGLHECGLSLGDQFSVELQEECGLTVIGRSSHIGVYENIAPDMTSNPGAKQWHWVIHVLAVPIRSLDSFVNKEPDKHPEYRFITADELPTIGQWSAGLDKYLETNLAAIKDAIRKINGR